MNKSLLAITLVLGLLSVSQAGPAVACVWASYGVLHGTPANQCQDVSSPGLCYSLTTDLFWSWCSSTDNGTTVKGVGAKAGYFFPATVTAAAPSTVAATACTDGCAVCTAVGGATCTTVKDGYVKKADNTIAACIAGAKTCTEANVATKATACKDGFYPTGTTPDITACTASFAGCKTSTAETAATCTAAKEGFFLVGTAGAYTAITACDATFLASTCTSATVATACQKGYGLAAGVCGACPVNCKDCAADKAKCAVASDGFFLNIATGLPSATCHDNCLTCKAENHMDCVTCKPDLNRGLYANAEVVANSLATPTPIVGVKAYSSCNCFKLFIADAAGMCKSTTPKGKCKQGKKKPCKKCAPKSKKNKKLSKCKTANKGYKVWTDGSVVSAAVADMAGASPVVAPAARLLEAGSNFISMTVAVMFSMALIIFG